MPKRVMRDEQRSNIVAFPNTSRGSRNYLINALLDLYHPFPAWVSPTTFMVYRGHTAFHAELGKKWCPFPKIFPVIFRENRLWLVPHPTKDSHPCIDSDGGAIPRGTVNLQASPGIRKKCRHQWLEGPITSHATPSLTTRMMLTGSQLQMIMRKGRSSSLNHSTQGRDPKIKARI